MNPQATIPDRATQKEFAALLGCSEPMVNKHKNAGRLVMDGREVLVRESLERINAWKDPARGGDRTGKPAAPPLALTTAATHAPAAVSTSSDADRMNYNVQAAREKLAAAQLRELELAREAAQLVLKAERDSAEFSRARAGREAIMSIADRVSVLLAAESDAAVIHATLTAECRKVCTSLAAIGDVDSAPLEASA